MLVVMPGEVGLYTQQGKRFFSSVFCPACYQQMGAASTTLHLIYDLKIFGAILPFPMLLGRLMFN
jgi:hypothetical protein